MDIKLRSLKGPYFKEMRVGGSQHLKTFFYIYFYLVCFTDLKLELAINSNQTIIEVNVLHNA
jgi:hypothetical protein